MKIAYVILHYMTCNDTIECAESILRIASKSIHQTIIIIVDNGSKNNSYYVILNKFKNNSKVVLLQNERNLGFACGNNVGFLYAKTKFMADFIVQINNDIIINQQNFNDLLVQKYNERHYTVLGPDIVTLDGRHQNPVPYREWTYNRLFTFRLKKKIQFLLAHFEIFDKFLTLNKNAYSHDKTTKEILNATLHGACYIFSPNYISQFDGMYDKTFLYMEEDILKLQAEYYGYLMMYSPELEVIHKEDMATNTIINKSIDKKKMVYKYLLDSSKAYYNLKREYKKKDVRNDKKIH